MKAKIRLREINKDRRYKLSYKDYPAIRNLYKLSWTMAHIAKIAGVSHQRISQIIDRKGTEKDRGKVIARRNLRKYRMDKKYRARMLEQKRNYWKYKKETILKYERSKAKKKVSKLQKAK